MFTEKSTIEDLVVYLRQNFNITTHFYLEFQDAAPKKQLRSFTMKTTLEELLDLQHTTPTKVF